MASGFVLGIAAANVPRGELKHHGEAIVVSSNPLGGATKGIPVPLDDCRFQSLRVYLGTDRQSGQPPYTVYLSSSSLVQSAFLDTFRRFSIIRCSSGSLTPEPVPCRVPQVIAMEKLVCPVCSEVALSTTETMECPACGKDMVKITSSLLARLNDQPGELAKLLGKLAEKGINISTLRVVPQIQESGMSIAFFSVDRAEEALMIPEIEPAGDLPLSFQPQPPEAASK